ncbi:MAG: TrmH family RNA methyltransferase [Patescibacteria group bacterium]|nr:TrmH family RNA methyltransferase [Patescibacteria group bacterium]
MPNDFFLISHNIRSLYNVGSFFRTADAFGVTKIFLTGYTGTPKNFRLQKTALGAEKSVPWEYHRQLKRVFDKLRQQRVRVVALENNVPNTIPLTKFRPKFPLALLLGEEVRGIKKDYLGYCDNIVEIPMRGQKESLNVAVAAGIAIHYMMSFRT